MTQQRQSEYPTDALLDEMVDALEKDDPKEIAAVLKKCERERQAGKPSDGGPDGQSANSEETKAVPEQAKGEKLHLKWVVPASAGLLIGILLGVAIGDHLPERFEKTTDANVRFDTRTKQNCWVGPSQWDEPTGRLFTGPPNETYVPNIPLCKNL